MNTGIYAVDIETTGLDWEVGHQILEFGCVHLDLKTKKLTEFRRIFKYDTIIGQIYALVLNAKLLEEIKTSPDAKDISTLSDDFHQFVVDTGSVEDRITIAGKNAAGFDIPFLKHQAGGFFSNKLKHRVIDPAYEFMKSDEVTPPNLTECLKRAGMQPTNLHTAVADAHDILRLHCAAKNIQGVY